MPRLSDWQPDTFEIKIGDMLLSVVDSNEYVEDSRKEMHFHSVFEFQYVRSKPMKIRTEGKTHNVCDGEYIIIPPNSFHSSESLGVEKSCFLFSVNFLPKVKGEISEYRYYNRIFSGLKRVAIHKNATVTDCINRLVLQKKNSLAVHKKKIIFGMLFMAVAEDLWDENPHEEYETAGDVNETAYKQKLRGVVGDYISRYCNEENILSAVADILHMSERNTARIIKEIFGVPVSTLVLNQRMVYAKELIAKKEMALSEIAEKVGYKHYNTFYKAFKKYYGVSPEREAALIEGCE